MRKLILIILTMFLLCAVNSYAEIPRLINYQGKLTDSQGSPITGTKAVTFRIYDTESGGSALWSEAYSNLAFDRGIFNVMLGGVTALNLSFDKPYWLSIQVGGDPEMSPRIRLASVGYAFNTERLGGKFVTEFSLANHAHDASNINAGILPVVRGGTGVNHKTMTAVPYTGTGLDNTVIPHGLGTTPTFVFICATTDFGANAMFWGKDMPTGLSKDLVEYSEKTDCIKGVDSTNLILGPNSRVNMNGVKYVALCAAE